MKNSAICEERVLHTEVLKAVRSKMPKDERLFDLAELFKIFGDSTRMKILFVLFEAEVCTCDLAATLNMTASAVSHQLNSLKRAKLIKSRRDGKSVFYSLADDHVKTIIEMATEHLDE
ncbi:MAG: helix-turn-helix transcriptional regulator [Ruminococcaceae bacterium]|nr:helix-turn-helix transcriptional regulator [Oscillospiraceae bacterium]